MVGRRLLAIPVTAFLILLLVGLFLPARHELARAVKQTLHGGMKVVVLTSETKPHTRLVRTMGDASPFFGSWAYDFTPEGEGCRVVLRESGEVRNPCFRAMAWLFGLDKHVTQHLNDLARKFGEIGKVVTI